MINVEALSSQIVFAFPSIAARALVVFLSISNVKTHKSFIHFLPSTRCFLHFTKTHRRQAKALEREARCAKLNLPLDSSALFISP
jgi:hypothetical protein